MRAIRVTVRVLLGILGGYLVSAASSAALALILCRVCGFDRAQSTVFCGMLGFAFYFFALLWALSTPRLGRLATVFIAGGCLAYGVVLWLSPASAVALSTFLIPFGAGG
jgi:hypothetical protein